MIRGSLKRLLQFEIIKHQNVIRTISTTGLNFQQPKKAVKLDHDIVIKSPYPDIDIPDLTIDQFVWKNFRKWENRVAVVDGVTDKQFTYAELRDKCRILAIRLQTTFNLKYGDTIAVCLPNCPEFPLIALAGLECGIIVTTINPIYTAGEISNQLSDSGAKLLFGIAHMSQTLKDAVKLSKQNIQILYVRETPGEAIPDDGIDLDGLIENNGIDFSSFKEPFKNINDISLLPYSSGTTGKAKGVLLTHRNIVSNSIMVNSGTGKGAYIQETTDTWQDVLPCVLPFFHIYGLTVTLISKLALGAKIVTLPNFKPETFLNALEKHQGTVLHLVPPIVIFLSNYDKVKDIHTNSIKFCSSGAAPLGGHDVERFLKKAPDVQFLQGYGLTETAPVVLMNEVGSTNFASVGKPCPNTEVKIVAIDDPTFKGLGSNQSGELLIRGPQVMKGYHNNQEATDETLLHDGYMRTGDIAHYDDNLDFYITDRLKELIKVKGFQVAPAELEEVLRDHPKLVDAAVIGVPDPISGELPRAFVVKKENEQLSEKEIKDFVAARVAPFKKLEGGVVFLDAIPKNATGKIMRRIIKEQYC